MAQELDYRLGKLALLDVQDKAGFLKSGENCLEMLHMCGKIWAGHQNVVYVDENKRQT